MKTKTISFDNSGVLVVDDRTANIFAVLLGSLLIALLAQISIPVPFSPIPITGQTIGVILVGGLLGARRGAISILCYIFEGAMGMPVFAQMKSGIHVLVGPTAGYLWGFVIAAFLIGLLTERGYTKRPIGSFISCFASTTIILIIGMLYLAIFKGFTAALLMGFYPFLVGDVVKSAICAGLLTSVKRF
jgi:biotin transport system substrate-specific component